MQARNTYLKFKWPHWQEILDKSDVSHMLVVPVCEDYWDWDQSIIRVLPRQVTATYLTIVTQSCRPVATISRHPQFSHRYTVSYTVFRKGTYQHLLLVESTLHCPFTLSEYMKTLVDIYIHLVQTAHRIILPAEFLRTSNPILRRLV